MCADWVPFGLNDEELDHHQVLVDGVPDWLKEPLIAWIFQHVDYSSYATEQDCLEIQLATRLDIGVRAGMGLIGGDRFRSTLRALSDVQLLRIADFLVTKNAYLEDLDVLLKTSNSKWTIGERLGRTGLVERVPEGVRLNMAETTKNAGSAGSILARAWAHVHGFEKNDSSAYMDAVRAVEIAAVEAVQSNNPTATLGTVIKQMLDQSDWRLPFREHKNSPSSAFIVDAARTLWHGHRDRHGSANYTDVTHEEARAAVSLAATLVDWFTSGAVQRRPV